MKGTLIIRIAQADAHPEIEGILKAGGLSSQDVLTTGSIYSTCHR
jgi:hypothetical protein